MASRTHETPDIRTQYTSSEEHARHATSRPATKMVVIEGGAHRRGFVQEQPASPAHVRSRDVDAKPASAQDGQPRHAIAPGGGDPDQTMSLTAADVARVREEARKLAKHAKHAKHAKRVPSHVRRSDSQQLIQQTDAPAAATVDPAVQDDPNRPQRVVRQAPTRRDRRAAKHAQKLEAKHAADAEASTPVRDSAVGAHARVDSREPEHSEQVAPASALESVAAEAATGFAAQTSAPVRTSDADAPVRKTVDTKPDKREASPKQPHGRRAKRAAQEQRTQAKRTAHDRERQEHEQWNDALKAIGIDPQEQRRKIAQEQAQLQAASEEAVAAEAVTVQQELVAVAQQEAVVEQERQRPEGAPTRKVVVVKGSKRRSRKAGKAAADDESSKDSKLELRQSQEQPADESHDDQAPASADGQPDAPLIQTVVRNEAVSGDRPQRVVVDGKSKKRGASAAKKPATDTSDDMDTSSHTEGTKRGAARAASKGKGAAKAKEKRNINIHPVAGIKIVAGGVASAAQKIGHGVATHRIQVAVVLAVVLVLGTMLYPAAREYYISVRELDRANAQLAQINERNALIQEGIDQMTTDTGIEDYMRAQYGWVKRGETAVAVTGLDEGDKLAITRLDSSTNASSAVDDSQDSNDSLFTQILDAAFFVDTTTTTERHVVTAEEAAAARAEAEAQAQESDESGSADSADDTQASSE